MAPPFIIRIAQRHPLLLGVFIGLCSTAAIALFSPTEDLPGHSRRLMAVVGPIYLVPMWIATVYAGRSMLKNIGQLPRLRLIWLGACLFFSIAVGINSYISWKESRRFAYEGRSVDGTVIETHPEDHGRLLVSYTVSNVDYRTMSAGPRGVLDYRPGQSIPVYYHASAPAQGFCIQFSWRPGWEFATWIFTAGMLPLWFFALVAKCDDVRLHFARNR